MNKVLLWVSIVLVLVFGGRAIIEYMSRSANERAATLRVEAFLGGLSKGGDFQAAFNAWRTGTPAGIQSLTQDQYNAEVQRLRGWLAARQLAEPVGRYEILSADMVAPPEGLRAATVVVACSIDGRELSIRSVTDEALEWVD